MATKTKMKTAFPWSYGHIIRKSHSSVIDALAEADLMWNVEKRPIYMVTDSSELAAVHDKYVIVRSRDEAIMGVVGDRYLPLQNSKAFEFMSEIVDSHEVEIVAAGSVEGGRKVYLTATVQEREVAGVRYNDHLFCSTTHDGSGSVTVGFLIVSENGNVFNCDLAPHQRVYRVRHTPAMEFRAHEGSKALKFARDYFTGHSNLMANLSTLMLNRKQVGRLIDRLLPLPTEEGVAKENAKVNQDSLGDALAGVHDALQAFECICKWDETNRKSRETKFDRGENLFKRVVYQEPEFKQRALEYLTGVRLGVMS